jgi:hypothetical protein
MRLRDLDCHDVGPYSPVELPTNQFARLKFGLWVSEAGGRVEPDVARARTYT